MKSKILLFVFILSSSFSFAQQDCDCETALSRLINKIENEYPGFEDKTTDTLRYLSFKEKMIADSKNTSKSECLKLLRSYLDYFRDKHIYLQESGQSQSNHEKEKYYSKVKITLEEFNKHLRSTDDSLEGIWKTPTYKVGIVKSENQYHGFIIDADTTFWKPYEIKFSLLKDGKANYYMQDHSLYEDTYKLHENCILYFNRLQTAFVKEQAEPLLSQEQIEAIVNKTEGFYFEKMTDKTALLRISSFMYNNVDRIEKLIRDNSDLLENSENLIIDIRNNGGGTDVAYKELLPYICNYPLRLIGARILATQALIDGMQNWMDNLPDEEKYQDDKERIKRDIETYRKHLGEFVGSGSKAVYIDTIKAAAHSPAQIVILANKGTASAAESFIYKAKQSKKVKIMGTPTGGVLDYGSARNFDFGCDNYSLSLPTYRSLRLPDYPIDNIGIQPDIYLDKYVEDWHQFAIDYLENE
ncbi:MAG: S41 family peptidase [bacterium]